MKAAEGVIDYLNQNVRNAQLIIKGAVKGLAGQSRDCKCGSALKHALITHPASVPADTRKKLELLVGKYLNG